MEVKRWDDNWQQVLSGPQNFRLENAVFWDVTASGSCKNRRFGGKYRLHHQGDMNA
jgi:hypothetical protein